MLQFPRKTRNCKSEKLQKRELSKKVTSDPGSLAMDDQVNLPDSDSVAPSGPWGVSEGKQNMPSQKDITVEMREDSNRSVGRSVMWLTARACLAAVPCESVSREPARAA